MGERERENEPGTGGRKGGRTPLGRHPRANKKRRITGREGVDLQREDGWQGSRDF